MDEGNSNVTADTSTNAVPTEHVPISYSDSDLQPNQNSAADTEAKVDRITQACRDRDLCALRELAAAEGGLINDDLRRTACEFLPRRGLQRCH